MPRLVTSCQRIAANYGSQFALRADFSPRFLVFPRSAFGEAQPGAAGAAPFAMMIAVVD
jgi:hypothetical protein